MSDSIYIILVYNVSLLLAMGLIYEVLVLRWRHKQAWLQHAPIGFILGLIGIAVMLTPWEFAPGIVYDTRSVLLSISGLFFGAAPTAIAMAMTMVFRIYMGGAGVLTGVTSILATGAIGLAWRHWRRGPLAEISWGELYIFGFVVHIAVLLAVLTLPWGTALRVLATIALPVLVIYPLGTAMLGTLMANLLKVEYTEESLRENEERYRLLFNCINDAAYVYPLEDDDRPGSFIEANELAWKRLGYTREELFRLSPLDINDALKDEDRIQVIMRRLKEEGQILLESTHLARDGRAIPVEINAKLFELKGRPTVLCIVRDITERKRTEDELSQNHQKLAEAAQSLEQSRNMLQLIIESIPVRVFWKDRKHRFLGCNNLFAKDAGLSKPEELLGKDDFAMGWREQADQYRADDRQVMESRRPKLNIIEPQTTPAGGTIWLNTSKVPLQTPDGEVFGVLGVYEDITERRAMEEALRVTRENLELALKGADLGTWDWNIATDEITFNERWTGMLGYRLEELEPHLDTWEKLVHPEDLPAVMEALQAHLEGKTPSFEAEYRLRHKSGDWVWIFDKGMVIERDAKGRAVRACGIHQDITQRKRAEEALAEEAIRRRLLVEQSRDGIVVLDQNGKVYEANRQYAEMLGYSPEEVLDLYVWDWDVQWTREELLEQLRLVDATGDHFETRHRRKDGCFIDVETSTNGVILGGQKLVFCICRDISGRKATEQALRESEATYRALIEGLPDIVMRFDREGRHLFVSSNVSEAVNLPAREFIGKTHRDLGFPAELCRFWEEALGGVFTSGRPSETEFLLEGPQGQAIYNWRLIPEMDAQGMVQSVLSFSRDITPQRRAEENYRTLFREMLDGFGLHEIICDSQGHPADYRFLAVNPAFERLTGLNGDELVGRTVKDVLPGTEQHWIDAYGRVALTGEPAFFESYSADFKKHFKVTAFRPAPNQFACIFTDITERKQAEEEKAALEAQLAQAQKMEAVGTLAGGIAHDFNNILWAIMGFAELSLQEVPPGSRLANNLQQVVKASERAKDLVNQILTFSRKQEKERKPLKISLLIKEALKLLRATIPTTIEIKQDILSPEAQVTADPTQIHQLIVNLCTNAAYAMRDKGGILEVRLEEKCLKKEDLVPYSELSPGPYVILMVSDTGHGIDQKIIDKIFDPFFTTKAVGEGTGMGLAVVYGIVKAHGGGISVSSQPEAGARFTIVLPEIASPAAEVSQKPSPAPRGRGRLLVIDDEKILVNMTKEMLEHLGYEVTTANDGLEALSILQSRPDTFDLIVTDQTMPHLTGLQLAREIRLVRPGLPIILCTGFSDAVSEATVKAAGINELLMKPITLSNLGEAVSRALGGGCPTGGNPG